MDLPDFYTHSFIVRISLDEAAKGAKQAVWHGHIVHVPSGERRYIKELDEIRVFIMPYLERMGIKFHKS